MAPGAGSRAVPADLAGARQRIAELERKIGQQQLELDFSASLVASQRAEPGERRAWRHAVYALIEAMTTPRLQGGLPVERLCALAGVSRAGSYRQWQVSAPRREETAGR
jgi:hypothetical protein